MKRVEVEWVDSMVLNYGEWAGREEHEEAFGEMTHRSCGYLFSDSDKGLILAQSVYEGNEGDRAAGAMFIPRPAVLSVTELEAK